MKSFNIFTRGCLVRILFYGLFLLGPYILTESHSLYVKAKNECAITENVLIREIAQSEYKQKVRFLDCLGVSCLGVWFFWLVALIFMKLIQLGKNKPEPASSKQTQPAKVTASNDRDDITSN